jgi:hypothetical protein
MEEGRLYALVLIILHYDNFILHQDMGYHDKTVINICHPHDDGDHLARSIII